jgi:hypothetical protein
MLLIRFMCIVSLNCAQRVADTRCERGKWVENSVYVLL